MRKPTYQYPSVILKHAKVIYIITIKSLTKEPKGNIQPVKVWEVYKDVQYDTYEGYWAVYYLNHIQFTTKYVDYNSMLCTSTISSHLNKY